LMGCSMSETQEDLLARHFKVACILLDGDEAGQTASGAPLVRLGRRMFVWAPQLPDGTQPDMMSEEEIRVLLRH
jgi:DNA primase